MFSSISSGNCSKIIAIAPSEIAFEINLCPSEIVPLTATNKLFLAIFLESN